MKMTKKEIMKRYLAERVDFEGLRNDVKNSWLKDIPKSEIPYNGIIGKYFGKLGKEAIRVAEYKFPDSDRTYLTLFEVTKELLIEIL